MKKSFLKIMLFVIGATALAAPAVSSSPDKPSDFYLFPKSQTLQLDERLVEATEIALLNARKHSHRRCWRSIKDALLEANVVPFRPTSRYARQAGEELEQKFGFIKLDISDPFDAPPASILVYGGRGSGHVEFRTTDGFVSDFFNPRPSRRPLLGVYALSSAVSKILSD